MSRSCDLFLKSIPRVGNNVSHSNTKTFRMFHLNLQSHSFYSKILNTNLSLKLSSRVARALLKEEFDLFILRQKISKLTPLGIKLKKTIKSLFIKNALPIPSKQRANRKKTLGARIVALKAKNANL